MYGAKHIQVDCHTTRCGLKCIAAKIQYFYKLLYDCSVCFYGHLVTLTTVLAFLNHIINHLSLAVGAVVAVVPLLLLFFCCLVSIVVVLLFFCCCYCLVLFLCYLSFLCSKA